MSHTNTMDPQIFDPKKRLRFFGSHMDVLTMSETLKGVERLIERRVPSQHCVINVAKLMLMRRDPKLMEIVNSCAMVNVDGQGIVYGARLLGVKVPERVAGIDIFMNLMKLTDEKQYRVYFFGARDWVVKKVVDQFSEEYPNMVVAGYRNGYYKPEEEEAIVRDIHDAKPDILIVAMSSPAKEFFIHKNLQALGVPFVIGVGGSFDVVAGLTERAPLWAQKVGLEWFFRMMHEPRRMFRRYMTSNLQYLALLMKALVLGKNKYGF